MLVFDMAYLMSLSKNNGYMCSQYDWNESMYSRLKGNQGTMIVDGSMCSEYNWNKIKVL